MSADEPAPMLDAELDQTLAYFRENGTPSFDELWRRLANTYNAMLALGIPPGAILGGCATALTTAMLRIDKLEREAAERLNKELGL